MPSPGPTSAVPAVPVPAPDTAVPVAPANPPADPSTTPPMDGSTAAAGRRTLSIAFVRVGPDGQLTVELRDGRTLVLRDVVMETAQYCGTPVAAAVSAPDPAGARKARHCGSYADVVAARPGGEVLPAELAPVMPGGIAEERRPGG